MKRISMNQCKKSISWEDGMAMFTQHCKIKNLTEKTIGNYELAYRIMGSYLNIETVNQITQQEVNNFIVHLL